MNMFVNLICHHTSRALSVLLVAATLTGCSQQRQLAPGQVWSYDSRPGEGASTIQILHVEPGTPVGTVYFVSVRALDVHRIGRKLRTTEVWPLVFTEEALVRSVKGYQWSQKVDRPYLKQLDFWLTEAREGRAEERTFNIPLKDALHEIERDQPEAERKLFAAA